MDTIRDHQGTKVKVKAKNTLGLSRPLLALRLLEGPVGAGHRQGPSGDRVYRKDVLLTAAFSRLYHG